MQGILPIVLLAFISKAIDHWLGLGGRAFCFWQDFENGYLLFLAAVKVGFLNCFVFEPSEGLHVSSAIRGQSA